jgi:hypothetical protein
MAYIVGQYYIGPWSRYDGSENTDLPELSLFKEKPQAIGFILKLIEGNSTREPFDDLETLNRDIEAYGYYNYNDNTMFTLELKQIQ